MRSGDTSGGGYDNSGEAPAAFLESDVNKMTNFMSSSTYYQHDHLKHQDFTEIGVYDNQTSINNHIASGMSLEPSRGSGKVLFTATQWQELERQTMIYKYIMASIPVPPQLLIPLSTQSNKVGTDLRFSSGSDPEPWRCRRTDGKKWRCSRDVAPDLKYCERHAHKSRPRSRKPVEIQPHNANITTSALNVTPTAYTTPNNTDMLPAATSSYQHQHPRCTEWLVKSGTVPVSSSSNQQFQQSMNSHSPRVGSKRTHIFPQDFEGNHQHEYNLNYSNMHLDSAGARRQHFIDAWSKSGAGDNCSLTLSMQCSGGIDDIDQSFEIGSLRSHNQWLNQGSWMSSQPGGPLGEALGLGIASNMQGPLNVSSSHGQSSSSTTSSSCEKGGSSHGPELSFIR